MSSHASLVSRCCRELRECIEHKDFTNVRRVHSLLIHHDLHTHPIVAGLLVRVFCLSHSLLEANLSFCKALNPSHITWHAMLSAHESRGEHSRVLVLYDQMQHEGSLPDRYLFTSVLIACGFVNDRETGSLVHQRIVKVGLDSDVAIGTTLVDIYAKWNCMETAHDVFRHLENRNLVTWGALIKGYVQHGHALIALDLFSEMQEEGKEPNKVIFLLILRALCSLGNLVQGRCLHDQILRNSFDHEICVGNALIDMYAKCGSIQEAKLLFGESKELDAISYGTMMSGYIQHGYDLCALGLLIKMKDEGISTNKYIFTCTLKAYANMQSLEQARLLHDDLIKHGVESDVAVGTALIDMYAKCDCLDEAIETFECLPSRNSVSWSVMLLAYTQNERDYLAFELFNRMLRDSVIVNSVTFLSMLKACVSLGSLNYGMLLHVQIIENQLELDLQIGSTLVYMYSKCGSIENAQKSFIMLPRKNCVLWCAMMTGYLEHRQDIASLELFERMHIEGIQPNQVAFLCALKACGSSGSLTKLRMIHAWIVESDLESDEVFGSALIDIYAKWGTLNESQNLFDRLQTRDVVVYSVLITAYVQHDNGHAAIVMFNKMELEGLSLDEVITSAIIKAYGLVGNLEQGMVMHHEAIHCGSDLDLGIKNALVDMYAKCGSIQDAEQLFTSGLRFCDVASWYAMIDAHAQHGDCRTAVQLYEKMRLHGVEADASIFLSVLKACSNSGSIQHGRKMHEEVIKRAFDLDETVCNALVDMYMKCGDLEQAHKLFNCMKEPNVVSWGALIVGYVQHGFAFSALHLYEKMQEQGIEGTEVIFPCILKACGLTGAMGQGMYIHDQVVKTGLEDDIAIGSALLGMYTKVGRLYEAQRVLNNLPNRDIKSWNTMLAGYVEHDECKLAKNCIENIQQDGLQLHGAAHTSILAAYAHIGNVIEGCQYFASISEDQAVGPDVEHLNSLIDILVCAGYLCEAEQLLHTMPTSSSIVAWTLLLDACKKYGLRKLGTQCFAQAVTRDPIMGSSYVLVSSMYSDMHSISVS